MKRPEEGIDVEGAGELYHGSIMKLCYAAVAVRSLYVPAADVDLSLRESAALGRRPTAPDSDRV